MAAINQANLDTNLDVICLSPGIYLLNQIQVADTGLPLITSPIEIQGNGAAIMRQSGAVSFRMFRVVAGGQLLLDSVSLEGGQLTVSDGGAIYNAAGTVVLSNSLVMNNSARNGGALYNDNGAVSVVNTTIRLNNAPTASGGGVLNTGLNSVLIITNSTISENGASSGGGLYNDNGSVTVTGSTISTNTATSAAGLFNGSFGSVSMSNSVMSGNVSVAFGGAVAASGATLAINNSCIVNNVSPLGSGITNLNSDPAAAPINAEQDWWGAADGPSGDGSGSGDAISGNVDYMPFLTSPLPFCPSTQSALSMMLHLLSRS